MVAVPPAAVFEPPSHRSLAVTADPGPATFTVPCDEAFWAIMTAALTSATAPDATEKVPLPPRPTKIDWASRADPFPEMVSSPWPEAPVPKTIPAVLQLNNRAPPDTEALPLLVSPITSDDADHDEPAPDTSTLPPAFNMPDAMSSPPDRTLTAPVMDRFPPADH
jgi:hypothetical protein